jgi:hypothetical protein
MLPAAPQRGRWHRWRPSGLRRTAQSRPSPRSAGRAVTPAVAIGIPRLVVAHLPACAGLLLLCCTAGTANATASGASSASGLSELAVTARLPFGTLQRRAAEMLAQTDAGLSGSQRIVTPFTDAGSVITTVRYQALQDAVSVARGDRGAVRVRLPLRIDADHATEGLAKAVLTRSGCGRHHFYLDALFQPEVVDGRIVVSERFAVDSSGYRCTVGLKGTLEKAVEVVDGTRRVIGWVRDKVTGRTTVVEPIDTRREISGDIRAGILAKARDSLDAVRPMLHGMLANAAAVRGIANRPVVFGGVIALGIDPAAFVASGVAVDDRQVTVSGTLRGRPRIHFGSDWPAPQNAPGGAGAGSATGFRLPLQVLFPRGEALLPVADERAGGGAGFRVLPVPARPQMVVLEYAEGGTTENLVWLTGSVERPSARATRFDAPMADVLDELHGWLDDPERWHGVAGIAALKAEVADLQRLLARFESPTDLPLGDAGTLTFRELRVDLQTAWVTPAAIRAKVVLRGRAAVDVTLDL